MKQFLLIAIVFFCASCGQNSAHLTRQSLALQKQLLLSLQEAKTIHDLHEKHGTIKKNIDLLTDHIIAADTYYREKELQPPSADDYSASLKHELQRLYSIPGGREFFERLEKENLIKLDGYAQSLIRR